MNWKEELDKLKDMTVREFKGMNKMCEDDVKCNNCGVYINMVCGNCGAEACNCVDDYFEMPEEEFKEKKMEKDATEGAVNMGQDANEGMAADDSTTTTRLLDKNWSPLVVRKYMHKGWPLFISLICDANLNDLDETVMSIIDEAEEKGFIGNTIQSGRNFCGFMSDELCKHYNEVKRGCNEGVAVLWYIDKCFISSLWGDFMVHAPCKAELFAIINTLPHI